MPRTWCAAASANSTVRPSSGYTELTGVTAVPAFGDQPGTVDVTPIAAKNRWYIFDLPDSGGTIAITVNDAKDFRTSFASMYSAYTTAVAANKLFWIEYAYPSETGIDSFYYPAEVEINLIGGGKNTLKFDTNEDARNCIQDLKEKCSKCGNELL